MTIERCQGTIKIHQREYIERTLQKFGMNECKAVGTPMDPGVKSQIEMHQPTEEEIQEGKNLPYLEAVGSLLYISQISRPDIAYAVNFVSSFNKNACNIHWNAVKRIFRYLKGTLDYKLSFKKNAEHNIVGYNDADWANDPKTRRSITGTTFTMCGGAISLYSKRQRTVALSTVEAEYMALAFSCQEGLWLRNLQKEIEPKTSNQPMRIYSDSSGAVNLSKNAITRQRTKHIDVRHHFVQEKVEAGIITVQHLSSEEIVVDRWDKWNKR
ncbi:hypothetical protein KPH14_012634 [Odynerus spinipes]|uniref:Uncharacterized protein n=1 Tax=Odynerus spinipes TaxID=1348599 RepID=A0AAD9VKJ5_9HYME|nr:hypothetical protein KPH14_012634 [Odynerus spinipes]